MNKQLNTNTNTVRKDENHKLKTHSTQRDRGRTLVAWEERGVVLNQCQPVAETSHLAIVSTPVAHKNGY